jgi:hypothetical protein
MSYKIRKLAILAVCVVLVALMGPAHVKDSSPRYGTVRGNDYNSALDEYLKTFLDVNLPIQKYASSVRWDAWERDCLRRPHGQPDPRGENLLKNLCIPDDRFSLDIIFIGNNHIPLFHKDLTHKGFKPYIISWHLQEELDDWDPYYILRHLRRDPIAPPQRGEPCIIIGDCHGKYYKMELPDPLELRKCGINKVHFHIELLASGLSYEDQLEHLKNAVFGKDIFWGQRKLYDYIKKLLQHNIEVQIDGLEPI